MLRPLMQRGIGDLEALFAKAKADVGVLMQLEHELQYRQVPRAVALLAEVQAAMHGTGSAAPAPIDKKVRGAQRDTAPSMPVEDAYKLLKATSGSAWESIEQTRRQLVQQSHPARLKSMSIERRNQALNDAKMVNAAYVVLSQARCSRSEIPSAYRIPTYCS